MNLKTMSLTALIFAGMVVACGKQRSDSELDQGKVVERGNEEIKDKNLVIISEKVEGTLKPFEKDSDQLFLELKKDPANITFGFTYANIKGFANGDKVEIAKGDTYEITNVMINAEYVEVRLKNTTNPIAKGQFNLVTFLAKEQSDNDGFVRKSDDEKIEYMRTRLAEMKISVKKPK